MSAVILVINSGSSSIKFALFDHPGLGLRLGGIADGLHSPAGRLNHRAGDCERSSPLPHNDHEGALRSIITLLRSEFSALELEAAGHRVVHGGEFFKGPVRIDENVAARIEELGQLAPLHNPANLAGIRATRKLFPGVPQIAVFDTAFHQTLPPAAFRYAIPERFLTDHKVRRYGAHGTSHQFVARRAAEILERPLDQLQLITVHLGNGCSACAIRDGGSVDTTMGLTPQEGMMMGTRSGDVDPTLHNHLVANAGESIESVTEILTKHSGLLGVSGITNDCRELETFMQSGNERATLALELFCYRAAKSILGMAAGLSRIDALVFTGGIGGNSSFVRRRIIEHLAVLRLQLDETANQSNGSHAAGRISARDQPTILVVNTDVELAIAQQTAGLL